MIDEDALSDARTLTPASARHSRLQDKTSDDDATLTDCDDRSDWERTPVHQVQASLHNLSAAESVRLSKVTSNSNINIETISFVTMSKPTVI